MSEHSAVRWAAIGAVSTFLTLVLGWWIFWSTPRGSLEATVNIAPFAWPPIADSLDNVSLEDGRVIAAWLLPRSRDITGTDDSAIVQALRQINRDRARDRVLNRRPDLGTYYSVT